MTKDEVVKIINEVIPAMVTAAIEEREKKIKSEPASSWAKEAWDKATKDGIFDGSAPKDNLTREQAAVVISRIDEKKNLGIFTK